MCTQIGPEYIPITHVELAVRRNTEDTICCLSRADVTVRVNCLDRHAEPASLHDALRERIFGAGSARYLCVFLFRESAAVTESVHSVADAQNYNNSLKEENFRLRDRC